MMAAVAKFAIKRSCHNAVPLLPFWDELSCTDARFRSKCQWAWCVQVEAPGARPLGDRLLLREAGTPYPDFGQVPHARMVCRALIAAQQSLRTEVAPPASALISA